MKKLNSLIVIGVLLIIAGIVGLVHPQWEGRDNKMEVDLGSQKVQVNTRRVTDIPPLFAGSIIVVGLCVIGLGAISRSAKKTS